MKWSSWKILGKNNINLQLEYRYNTFFVEINVRGTIVGGKNITQGTDGYKFPDIPVNLKPSYNIMVPIYGDYNNLCIRMYPEDNSFFTVIANKTVTTVEEYIAVNFVYGR